MTQKRKMYYLPPVPKEVKFPAVVYLMTAKSLFEPLFEFPAVTIFP